MPATSGTMSASSRRLRSGMCSFSGLSSGLKRMRWIAQSRYAAAMITPVVAMTREARDACGTSRCSTRNSPTNPFVPGHADAAERDDREQRREHRHDARDAAVRLDQARVAALVDHADEEEQRARRDAVVDHHHQRALHALHGEREDAEHHEAEVAHRRVGDELLEVRLHQRRRARRRRCRSPRA